MRRRFLRLLGFALSVLCGVASVTHAQEDRPIPPMFIDLPGIPTPDAPQPPIVQAEAPKNVEPNLEISPNTSMPRMETAPAAKTIALTELALVSNEYIDPRYAENSSHPHDMGLWEKLCTCTGDQFHRLVIDYKNFYLSENMLYVGLAVGIAAPLANTNFDQNFRNGYQRQAGNSQGAQNTALFFKNFGETKYVVAGFTVLSLEGCFCGEDHPILAGLGDFGDRGLRALLVGAPTVGILQVGLGSDRPYTNNSHWQPFNSSHGVSGHAFVGAVPFLTAASMTDCRPLQALLFAGSFVPAWSRIQTDDHYFSQVFLGWTIAYLSVHAVNLTEAQNPHVHVVPVEIPKGVGLGVQIDF